MGFEWNGSYLGSHPLTVVTSTRVVNRTTYWSITIDGTTTCCIRKSATNYLACVIDELKPIFSVSKIGTHSIRVAGVRYILIRASIMHIAGSEMIIHDKMLNDQLYYQVSQKFYHQVQDAFAFREILGLTRSHEGSICLRDDAPVNMHDTGTTVDRETSILPCTVLHKWFSDTTVSQVVRRMVDMDTDLVTTIAYYRSVIESVIHRVDTNTIWISSYIVDRLMNRLTDGSIDVPSWTI